MALRTDLTDSTVAATIHADQHNEANAQVLGLGTASTHAATDFDPAGAATTAQNNAQAYARQKAIAMSIVFGG